MQETTTRDPNVQDAEQEPDVRTQTEIDLAWLPERVARGKTNLALVADENRELALIELAPPGKQRAEQLVGKHLIAMIRAPYTQPDRVKVTKVTCHTRGASADLRSDQDYDAVFWTESAVEKFLYPYYHSQRLWSEKMDALKREFEWDKNAVAIAHRAPSTSSAVTLPSLTVGVIQQGDLTWMDVDAYLIAAAKSRSNGSRDK